MFKGKLRTTICGILCVCMMMLNVPVSVAAPPDKLKPPKKPPTGQPAKPPKIETPDRPTEPAKHLELNDDANRRVLNYVQNLKQKDVMIPIVAQLTQRYISGVSDKNELDIAFENSLRKHPRMEKYLPSFLEAYNAIPENIKVQKLVLPHQQTGGRTTTDAVTVDTLEKSLKRAFPELNQTPAKTAYDNRIAKNPAGIKKWKDEPFGNIQIGQIEYVQKPRITHLTPTGREPGDTLSIYGMNFQSGKTHKIILTYKDIENAEPEYFEQTVVSSSRIDFVIPDDMVPGNYQVQIQAPGMLVPSHGGSTVPISDPASYEIGIPKYKVYFNKMKCIDETRGPNNENIYQDSLVTFWGIGADERGWFKHSKKYAYFNDGAMKQYDSTDKCVLTPGGDWNKVQYGLVIYVDLYEWNWTSVESGESDEILDWAYCFYEEMSANNGWGGIIGSLLDLVALLLTPLVDLFVNLFTADPRHIENEVLEFDAMDLQTMLGPGKSTTGTLNFKGQDGEYDLYYQITRQ